MRKNWLTTLAGIMVGLGTLPMLVTASHVALPLYWNACQFPLILVGSVGGILLGVAAKGVDEHSSVPQTVASTIQQDANAVAKAADGTPSMPVTVTATSPGVTVAAKVDANTASSGLPDPPHRG